MTPEAQQLGRLKSEIENAKEILASYSLTGIDSRFLESFSKGLRLHLRPLSSMKTPNPRDLEGIISSVSDLADSAEQLSAMVAALPGRQNITLTQMSSYHKGLDLVKNLRKNLVASMTSSVSRINEVIKGLDRPSRPASSTRRSEVRAHLEAS
jgi:hypothetical protein